MNSSKEFEKLWGKILAKSWKDPEYAKRVENDTTAVIKEMGGDVPQGTEYSVNPNQVATHSSIVVLPFPKQSTPLAMLNDDPPPPPHGGGSSSGGGSCCSSSVLCCCCCP